MSEQTQQVHVRRPFRASKEKLYRAWTEESQLKQWWKPMNKQLQSVTNELREGGTVRYQFENELTIGGQYKTVQPGEKLVYTWIWEIPEGNDFKGDYELTVQFHGNEQEAELEVQQTNFDQEHAVKPHQDGWEQALDQLQQYLESGA